MAPARNSDRARLRGASRGATVGPSARRGLRSLTAVEHAVLGPMKVLGTPIKLSDTVASVRTAPPTLGQHTDSVLAELGVSADEIADLKSRSVV